VTDLGLCSVYVLFVQFFVSFCRQYCTASGTELRQVGCLAQLEQISSSPDKVFEVLSCSSYFSLCPFVLIVASILVPSLSCPASAILLLSLPRQCSVCFSAAHTASGLRFISLWCSIPLCGACHGWVSSSSIGFFPCDC
jgi:hypothetical protein